MKKIDKGFYYGTFFFFLCIWYIGSFRVALEATIVISGNAYFINDVIIAYLRLKNTHFNFRQAMTRKEWVSLLIASIIIWGLFFSLQLKSAFIFAITIPLILPILLLYDIITSYFKKM